MLQKALKAAKDAEYLNVYALAPDRETELCRLVESAGFKKVRGELNDFWLGKAAAFSPYQLAFPMPQL